MRASGLEPGGMPSQVVALLAVSVKLYLVQLLDAATATASVASTALLSCAHDHNPLQAQRVGKAGCGGLRLTQLRSITVILAALALLAKK